MANHRIAGALFRPTALTGPIFGKELRVSGRRRRYYVLRFVYLLMLVLFVAFVWMEVIRYDVSMSAYRISRMAEAGKTIVAAVTWFQFVVCQLIAIVLLSTAISDEILHRTLGTLMTTPINSLQIVSGKLLSRLWQLILLLAISVPVLAVVRVFGGVPWGYLIGSVVLTLCTCIFLASVSLWFSIFDRRSYAVIIKSVITAGILFALLPWMAFMVGEEMVADDEEAILSVLMLGNPYIGLAYMTAVARNPRVAAMAGVWFHWQVTSGVLLAGSVGLLAACVAVVRKVASRQAAGETGWSRRRRWFSRFRRPGRRAAAAAGAIRRVRGLPMVWKELRAAGRNRRKFIIGGSLLLAIVLLTYGIVAADGDLDEAGTHIVYSLVFVGLGTLGTTAVAGSAVGGEKESRTLPLLLVTTLTPWQVMFGKAVGVARRSLPYWGFLGLHLVLFTMVGYMAPTIWLHTTMIVVGVAALLTGSGLYFGALFRRTVTAVVMNLGLVIALWVVIPLLMYATSEVARADDSLAENYVGGTPWVQTVVVAEHDTRRYEHFAALGRDKMVGTYYWPEGAADFAKTTARLLTWAGVYVVAGLVLTWRAAARLRRRAV